MNIKLLKKIQKARRYFLNETIKKSGKNNFKDFNYWELKDLIPVSHNICEKLSIEIDWNYDTDKFYLLVYDLEQEDNQEAIVFSIPIVQIIGNSMMQMQDIGGIQTYAERYLLQQLYNIVDNDTIDKETTINNRKFVKKPSSNGKFEPKNNEKNTKKPGKQEKNDKKSVSKEEKIEKIYEKKITKLANIIGDRLYKKNRTPITENNVSRECDILIKEGLMNLDEKKRVLLLV